jgi:hypothetical protein
MIAGKLIAVNKTKIFAKPSACNKNCAFKTGIHGALKSTAPLPAATNAATKVPNVETIATVFADLSFLIKSNNKAVTKGININDSNI